MRKGELDFMNIDSIQNGVVLDHIQAGKSMDIYKYLHLDVLGYIDPNITVNVIRNGQRVAKKHLELPQKLVNIIHCKNPRCITVAEPQLDAIFLLSDPVKHTYRCAYCDTEKQRKL